MKQPITVSMRTRQPVQTGNQRVLELLAVLQMGLCGRCGRARYATRSQARRAARIGMPGRRLRAYRCGDAWHLTSHSRPQWIAGPVTLAPHFSTRKGAGKSLAFPRPSADERGGLDLDRGGERAYTHGYQHPPRQRPERSPDRSCRASTPTHAPACGRERGDGNASGPVPHAGPGGGDR